MCLDPSQICLMDSVKCMLLHFPPISFLFDPLIIAIIDGKNSNSMCFAKGVCATGNARQVITTW